MSKGGRKGGQNKRSTEQILRFFLAARAKARSAGPLPRSAWPLRAPLDKNISSKRNRALYYDVCFALHWRLFQASRQFSALEVKAKALAVVLALATQVYFVVVSYPVSVK